MKCIVILTVIAICATRADAQKGAKCVGDRPDSTFTTDAPVYRNCEVDVPANMLKPVTPINRGATFLGVIPIGQCLYAGFTFVVDTMGQLELSTVRPHSKNSPEAAEVVLTQLQRAHWEPALLDNRPVRQATELRLAFGYVYVTSPQRGAWPPSRPSTPATRPCRL